MHTIESGKLHTGSVEEPLPFITNSLIKRFTSSGSLPALASALSKKARLPNTQVIKKRSWSLNNHITIAIKCYLIKNQCNTVYKDNRPYNGLDLIYLFWIISLSNWCFKTMCKQMIKHPAGVQNISLIRNLINFSKYHKQYIFQFHQHFCTSDS